MIKTFTAMDCGSGLNETNFSICRFNLEANKSISGSNSSCLIISSETVFNEHPLSLFLLDPRFFICYYVKNPGICAAVIQFFVNRTQSRNSWTKTSISTEAVLSTLFIADMAEVLSM